MAELRMRDLCARTGLSRQTIHFYVEHGLVEAPAKTGRTMAYYTEAHVERLALIKRLQDEHFLPLRAIRAILDDPREAEALVAFTPAQREVLASVKAKVSHDARDSDVEVAPLLAKTGVTRGDFTELVRLGLVAVAARGRKRFVSAEDAWLVELWGRVRAAGFTRERGFMPDLLLLFEEGVGRIFEQEKRILARLASELPADVVADLVNQALPLVHALLVRSHERKVRDLFASMGASS
jgi:DNA-binding transcriptional MerR regulator